MYTLARLLFTGVGKMSIFLRVGCGFSCPRPLNRRGCWVFSPVVRAQGFWRCRPRSPPKTGSPSQAPQSSLSPQELAEAGGRPQASGGGPEPGGRACALPSAPPPWRPPTFPSWRRRPLFPAPPCHWSAVRGGVFPLAGGEE